MFLCQPTRSRFPLCWREAAEARRALREKEEDGEEASAALAVEAAEEEKEEEEWPALSYAMAASFPGEEVTGALAMALDAD